MKKLSPVSVGMAIKTIREQSKMSANDLAKQTGMTASSLSRTENGYRAVELSEAVTIAQCAGTSLDELIKLAEHLESSPFVHQREAAMAEMRRSMTEVKDAAIEVLRDLRKSTAE